MLEDHFHLTRRPFTSLPTSEDYFPAASIETARRSVVRQIERNEGPGLVIGGVGVGKSQLCELLAESFCQRCRVVVVPSGRMSSRKALLQAILFELGLSYQGQDEGELRLSLIDYATDYDICPRGILLLVDEGENLSLPLLDELRSLTNFASDGKPCIRLIMFGAPRLEEKFTHPRLESFNQRIAGRYYLEAFTADETTQFIRQIFDACGGNSASVFTQEALQKIHGACDGIPRLINQLADHSLVLAADGNHIRVDGACVDEAWADLQQLPMPFENQRKNDQGDFAGAIVEFGNLADDGEDHDVLPVMADQNENPLQPADPSDLGEDCDLGDDCHLGDDGDQGEDRVSTAEVPESTESDAHHESSAGVTLVFHSSDNPFGDDFDEEEQIVDHFVSPDALAQRHRRQVETKSSRWLAEQLTRLRHSSIDGHADLPADRSMLPDKDEANLAVNALMRDNVNSPHSTANPSALEDTLLSRSDPSESMDASETSASADDDHCEIILLGDHVKDELDSHDPPGIFDVERPIAPESRQALHAAKGAERMSASGQTDPYHNYRHLFSQLRLRRGLA